MNSLAETPRRAKFPVYLEEFRMPVIIFNKIGLTFDQIPAGENVVAFVVTIIL